MKLNQWTLGLAAVGVVSLASAVNAEETMSTLGTALSSTTISGYVDTSINWNGLNDTGWQPPIPHSDNKANGFNLNVVNLTIEKALDESEWASGYKMELLFGPDAVSYNPSINSNSPYPTYSGSDFGIKQAYVALRTPVGNGIDWKLGVFDTIIGYESFAAGKNPNFTRSYGNAIEPTQHTGILASYRLSETVAVAAGVANTLSSGIDNKTGVEQGVWHKTAMASITVTAPQDMGCLSGSTLYGGIVYGINEADNEVGDNEDWDAAGQVNYYLGATINTPVTGLKAGLALDLVDNYGSIAGNDVWDLAGYLSYQATEKLSLHGRAEYGKGDNDAEFGIMPGGYDKVTYYAFTGTLQYDLWKNVISRLEARYDYASMKDEGHENAIGLYANFIYKF